MLDRCFQRNPGSLNGDDDLDCLIGPTSSPLGHPTKQATDHVSPLSLSSKWTTTTERNKSFNTIKPNSIRVELNLTQANGYRNASIMRNSGDGRQPPLIMTASTKKDLQGSPQVHCLEECTAQRLESVSKVTTRKLNNVDHL